MPGWLENEKADSHSTERWMKIKLPDDDGCFQAGRPGINFFRFYEK
jgi:hypothetical protein